MPRCPDCKGPLGEGHFVGFYFVCSDCFSKRNNPPEKSEKVQIVSDHLIDFCFQLLDRKPDQVIGPDHNPYMHRWFIVKSPQGNIYLHKFFRSDDDRALHDHPWAFRSFVIAGGYWEHTARGREWIEAGAWTPWRAATHRHMVEIPKDSTAITLVITEKHSRNWGFHCPDKGFVPWQEFTAAGPNNKSQHIGKGCG